MISEIVSKDDKLAYFGVEPAGSRYLKADQLIKFIHVDVWLSIGLDADLR